VSQKSILIAILLATSILLALVVTLISSVDVLIMSHEHAVDLQEGIKEWELDLTFASSVVADFCIAATLCFYLFSSRSEYFEGTNRILNVLCKYTINTGIIATIWALCCLIANVLLPNSYVELTFYLSLSKVYVNAFLGSLIVRDSLRAKSNITIFTPHLKSGSISSAHYGSKKYAGPPSGAVVNQGGNGASVRAQPDSAAESSTNRGPIISLNQRRTLSFSSVSSRRASRASQLKNALIYQ